MPLFRYIDAPEGLGDATYLHDTNPDAARFVEVSLGQLARENYGPVTAAQIEEPFANRDTTVEPVLATGGLITEPVLAIVGESGPEVVIPEASDAAETGTTEETA